MKYLMTRMAWILYFLGDLISKPMCWFDWVWLHPAYNWLMTKSNEIQERSGDPRGPWTF